MQHVNVYKFRGNFVKLPVYRYKKTTAAQSTGPGRRPWPLRLLAGPQTWRQMDTARAHAILMPALYLWVRFVPRAGGSSSRINPGWVVVEFWQLWRNSVRVVPDVRIASHELYGVVIRHQHGSVIQSMCVAASTDDFSKMFFWILRSCKIPFLIK